jgi:eukaryotic-like serine/threonine-protein kinase
MQLTHLGPYVIEKPLGKGGMGSVYAATDPQTGQRVAIKALTPYLAAAEGFRERFEAEIESLKTLKHNGIVRLYGYGEQDGVLFYSMELVEGISLEDELKAGRRFNWREVTNIAIQLSLALKHAHDHGIVHRDIKPANILLYEDEKVKLADFGIARLFGTTSLTTAGGVLGTADYMSPEQADGRPVTARCDQYSLGGVMYALLAGRPPFRAKNLPQMLQMQRFANPEPVRRYAPDTPEQLEQVIAQLLSKDPAERFPNTQVLARHLQAMVNALSRPAADDFALAGDQPTAAKHIANLSESLSVEATQAEVAPLHFGDGRSATLSPDRTLSPVASQNAATLAADDSISRQDLPGAIAPMVAESTVPPPPEPTTHFITVEEERLRQQSLDQRSWLFAVAQVCMSVVVIVCLAGVAYFLSRPPSADKLYSSITARVEVDDDASLGKVENEVNEFLNRFPNDPRTEVLQGYKERIELDKLERKLQRHTHNGSVNLSLLPAEQLYLEAIGRIATSPDESLTKLEALIDLYGVDAPVEPESGARGIPGKKKATSAAADRTADVVQLAKRRVQTLRTDLDRQHEQQLAALNERILAAERLASTQPQQAAAMYRAILNLNEGNKWAATAVEKARGRLGELEQK